MSSIILSDMQEKAVIYMAEINVKNRVRKYDEEDIKREKERIAENRNLITQAVRDYERMKSLGLV